MSSEVGEALRFPPYHLRKYLPWGPGKVDGIDPGDELLDVVDELDRVVGQATRREVRAGKLLHRFSSVLCRDPAGRLYVHRRTDDKDVYPGMYDMTAGGVLAARYGRIVNVASVGGLLTEPGRNSSVDAAAQTEPGTAAPGWLERR